MNLKDIAATLAVLGGSALVVSGCGKDKGASEVPAGAEASPVDAAAGEASCSGEGSCSGEKAEGEADAAEGEGSCSGEKAEGEGSCSGEKAEGEGSCSGK